MFLPKYAIVSCSTTNLPADSTTKSLSEKIKEISEKENKLDVNDPLFAIKTSNYIIMKAQLVQEEIHKNLDKQKTAGIFTKSSLQQQRIILGQQLDFYIESIQSLSNVYKAFDRQNKILDGYDVSQLPKLSLTFDDNAEIDLCVKYEKNIGWSKVYSVNGYLSSGADLNLKTESYSRFDSIANYAVVLWEEDEASIFKLPYYASNVNSSYMDVKDQREIKWKIRKKVSTCY